MNADNDVRAPFLKLDLEKADTAFVEKLAGFRPKAVYRPVDIFHPVLMVAQHPVVNIYQPVCDVVRFFDRFYDTNYRRVALPDLLKSLSHRLGSRTVPAASVG